MDVLEGLEGGFRSLLRGVRADGVRVLASAAQSWVRKLTDSDSQRLEAPVVNASPHIRR